MFKRINPFPQNAIPSILNDLRQFSIKMRRLRKYNCKNRGGVVRNVSRRERDISPTLSHPPRLLPPIKIERNTPQHRIPRGKESARKKVLHAFLKNTLRIVIDPHPPLFFYSQNPNLRATREPSP